MAGLNLPTSFAFTPDGRIFIAEKSGVVRVFKNGALLPTPLIDISAKVNNYWDRGLIGMALDPNFAANGYIYLLYPYEATATDDAGGKTARLSRYTVVGDTASPATETVLLGTNAGSACTQFPVGSDCIPAEWYGHGVGDIHFGSDGSMFLSNGDASSWNVVNDDALRAQDLNSLAGKIIRIDPNTGQGLPDNPYWNGDPNAARSKVWAYGVRNAYRFSVRPNSGAPGTVYAGDVGWDTTEEVNVVPRGANLGWPCYEGSLVQPGYQMKPVCQTLYADVAADPTKWTKPILTYDHNGTGAAITGGVFYTGTAYPAPYQGVYFYGDYARNQLRYASIDTSGVVTSGPTDFDPTADSPVDIQVGPDGNLYYLAIGSGQLIKYVYGTQSPGPGGFLSDLSWKSATNGYGPVEKDHSNGEQAAGDGNPITLNGVVYPKGLGMHAAADVSYAITGCTAFQSDIGVDDEVGPNGSVVFQVYLDGTKAYDSGTMTGSSTTKSISLDLTGKSELRLVVTNGGDTISYDHADWANPQIACTGTGGGGGGVGSAPTFGPATSLQDGTAPHSVVAADVSGDGKLDLVSANALSSNVGLFKGNGDGTFQAGTFFSVGAAGKTKTAQVADLNSDGKPDLVTANQDASTISVLIGTGGGAFAAAVQYPSCLNAHEVALGDLNADGKFDAAVACFGGTTISVLLGNGDGTFRPKVDYAVGSAPHSIVMRDFNGDGKPDLAVADYGSGAASVLRGVGDGTFQPAVNYSVGNRPHSIRAGDLNGDGKPDLVTADSGSDTVTVLLGNGDGTFASGQSYPTGSVPKSVAIGDVNGNGLPDVVTADTAGNGDGVTGNPGGDRVSVLLGDGTGALGARDGLPGRADALLGLPRRPERRRQARPLHGRVGLEQRHGAPEHLAGQCPTGVHGGVRVAGGRGHGGGAFVECDRHLLGGRRPVDREQLDGDAQAGQHSGSGPALVQRGDTDGHARSHERSPGRTDLLRDGCRRPERRQGHRRERPRQLEDLVVHDRAGRRRRPRDQLPQRPHLDVVDERLGACREGPLERRAGSRRRRADHPQHRRLPEGPRHARRIRLALRDLGVHQLPDRHRARRRGRPERLRRLPGLPRRDDRVRQRDHDRLDGNQDDQPRCDWEERTPPRRHERR